MRKGVRSLLEGHPGWTVCAEAKDGQEAVELVQKHRPDLVVLDLTMPVLNGLQAAQKIRSFSPKTKIVMLSMHSSPRVEQEALLAGVDVFLTKSDAGANFLRTIDALFDGVSN